MRKAEIQRCKSILLLRKHVSRAVLIDEREAARGFRRREHRAVQGRGRRARAKNQAYHRSEGEKSTHQTYHRRMAIGQAVTFAVRVLIGALFVVAGATKVGHFNDLAAAIAGFRLIPATVIAPLAVLLPFLEIGVGLYLIAGLFTRGAAILAGALLAIYSAAIASAVLRNIPANCGCFGPQDQAKADWPHVFIDLSLAAVCLIVAWRAPGSFSLDGRMRNA